MAPPKVLKVLLFRFGTDHRGDLPIFDGSLETCVPEMYEWV